MTIDEAISQERDNAEFSRCNDHDTSAEYHNKIAEWLEELKEFKQLYLGSDTYVIAKSNYDLGCEVGYNKAIDDFKKMLTIEKIKEYAESDGYINLNNCSLMIFDIAQQLKESESE